MIKFLYGNVFTHTEILSYYQWFEMSTKESNPNLQFWVLDSKLVPQTSLQNQY